MSVQERLRELFANGTEMVLTRHGNTNKKVEVPDKTRTEIDFARTLSDIGKDQAKRAHDGYYKNLPTPKAILSSPPSRTRDTALIVTGCLEEDITILQSGYPDAPIHDVVASEEAFDKIGYGSIDQFFACSPSVEECLRSYAERVLTDIIDSASKKTTATATGTAVYFFGHAMYTNTMALIVAEALNYSDSDISSIRSAVLSEATSFHLKKDTYSYCCPN
eukprot:TRINITY_DN5783_c0_g2_i1.p1 TRINITY_DN5783_c0_g2~~TRINITY_DN5783_c0_g2_i1.p1  ORF type:complete len:220 (+),score=48.57 TRINITY_DN5783_c0_g2_i1:22-681(+)